MLLTTPVISSLKHQYPDAEIDVLLYQDTIPIPLKMLKLMLCTGMGKKWWAE